MHPADDSLLWLPIAAVAAHLVEEFVWPGGFAAWYRWYRPARAASVTTPFLVWVNAVLVVIALVPPTVGRTATGFAWWLVVAAIGASNAAFHLWATARTGRYSPGVVTGTLLYVPIAAVGGWHILRAGRATPATAFEALLWGVGFHVWSAWNHRRRAAAKRGVTGR